jgi:hypothetical protein
MLPWQKSHDVVKRQYETSFSSFLTSTNSRARRGVGSLESARFFLFLVSTSFVSCFNVQYQMLFMCPPSVRGSTTCSRSTTLFFATYTQSTTKRQNDTKFCFPLAFSWTVVHFPFLFILFLGFITAREEKERNQNRRVYWNNITREYVGPSFLYSSAL